MFWGGLEIEPSTNLPSETSPPAKNSMLIAVRMLVVLSLITGVVYPLLVTGIATAIFPRQARGSLVAK